MNAKQVPRHCTVARAASFYAGTRNKVRILGTDFLPTVTQFIDPSVIPAFLGGSLVSGEAPGDPECRHMIGPGGVIPLSLRVGVGSDGLGDGEELHLAAASSSTLLLRVPEGARILWAWGCDNSQTVDFEVSTAPAAPGEPLPSEDRRALC